MDIVSDSHVNKDLIYRFQNFNFITLAVLGGLELWVWWSFGVHFDNKVMFGFVGVALVISRPLLTAAEYIARQKGFYDLLRLISLTYIISTTISVCTFAMAGVQAFSAYSQYAQSRLPQIELAQSQLDEAKMKLDEVRKANPYSLSDLAEKASQKTQVEGQIASVTEIFDGRMVAVADKDREARADHFKRAQTALQNFWDYNDGRLKMKNSQILDSECRPLPSIYGGGNMKTEAERLCPRLRALQKAVQTALPDSPEIKQLKEEKRQQLEKLNAVLAQLKPQVEMYTRLQNEEQNLKKAEQALIIAKESAGNAYIAPPPFVFFSRIMNGVFGVSTDQEKTAMLFFTFAIIVVFLLLKIFSYTQMILQDDATSPVPPPPPSPWDRFKKRTMERLYERLERMMRGNSSPVPATATASVVPDVEIQDIPIVPKVVPKGQGQPAQQDEPELDIPAFLRGQTDEDEVLSPERPADVPVEAVALSPKQTQGRPIKEAIPQEGQEDMKEKRTRTSMTAGSNVVPLKVEDEDEIETKYRALKFAIQNGLVANLSFANLKKRLGIGSKTAEQFRVRLLDEGIAVLDDKNRVVLIRTDSVAYKGSVQNA